MYDTKKDFNYYLILDSSLTSCIKAVSKSYQFDLQSINQFKFLIFKEILLTFKYDNHSTVVFLQNSPHLLEIHTEILKNYIIMVKAG